MSFERLAELLHKRMLNQSGISMLGEAYKMLAETLGEEELERMVLAKIFINPVLSPASNNKVSVDVPMGSKIISIDINSLKMFEPREKVAIVLHEIGHAHFGSDEEVADKFAFKKGFGPELISSLEKGISAQPELYNSHANRVRIDKIKGWMAAASNA